MTLAVAASFLPSLCAYALVQWKTTPQMRIQDAYKWLYQATLGGEHAVRDEQGPRRWLEREWAALTPPGAQEPELVRLTPDGSVLRVNLRPYKSAGRDRDLLLALFVMSAERFRGERGRFLKEWRSLGQLLRRRPQAHLTFAAWTSFDRSMSARGFPAVHHSPEYEKAYQPAYRVVLGELWADAR